MNLKSYFSTAVKTEKYTILIPNLRRKACFFSTEKMKFVNSFFKNLIFIAQISFSNGKILRPLILFGSQCTQEHAKSFQTYEIYNMSNYNVFSYYRNNKYINTVSNDNA